jgi:EpsI family protein
VRSRGWHFWALVALLLAGGAVVNLWESVGEARVERRALKDFPAELGAWRQRGADTKFDPETERVLRADDYLSRDFRRATDGAYANFYVGYYASQRNGATYHSPLNCLPGSGWAMTNAGTVRITPAGGGEAFEANRYVIESGGQRSLLVYWYQGRGRAVASEYWGKIYTVLDSAARRRSDGAMVRVVVPVGRSEEEALRTAAEVAALAAPHLSSFVPD